MSSCTLKSDYVWMINRAHPDHMPIYFSNNDLIKPPRFLDEGGIGVVEREYDKEF